MARSPLSSGKVITIFVSWWAIWALLQTHVLLGFGLGTVTALSDAAFSNTVIALCCVFISNGMQYYLPKKDRYWYILFISLGLAAGCTALCKAVLVPLLHSSGDPVDYAQLFARSWTV